MPRSDTQTQCNRPQTPDLPRQDLVVAETRAWVDRVVIGLNLCPFAKSPQVKGRVRYVMTDVTEPEDLLTRLIDELKHLADAPAETTETTLLIHPRVLVEFADYNDFLDVADAAVEALDLEGVIQIASFHPKYQFAGNAEHDPGNATNQSPYPMLHLIREESISRAVAALPEPEAIFEANMATMQKLGAAGIAELREKCRQDAEAAMPNHANLKPLEFTTTRHPSRSP